jgi:hypothetical protein
MQTCLAAVCLACVVAAAPSHRQKSFPYKAYVVAEDVYVRSGPGKTYYPTAKLQTGDVVEVYRHDPGGWYAIRPPEGSFAWVSGRYVKLDQDGLGVITGDRVAARVGSQFSDIREVIQVRLHGGEVVEILGTEESATGTGAAVWHKISPPSGEFRWISGKFVDPDFPHDGVRDTKVGANPLLSPSSQAESASRIEEAVGEGEALAAHVDPSGADDTDVRMADHQELVEDAGGDSPAVEGTANERPTWSTDRVDEAGNSTRFTNEFRVPAIDPNGSRTMRRISPEEFQAELDDIHMKLAIMLAEEPTVWQLDEMALRANQLLTEAETALERGRARLLVKRIEKSQDIKKRHDTLQGLQAATERRDEQLAALSRVQEEVGSRGTPESSPGFDGVGRLARVVSPKVGAPRYALVDGKGDVLCFVTPAPGINVQYYLGKRIGVTGTRGFIAEQQAQHVMAKHITSLDHQLR